MKSAITSASDKIFPGLIYYNSRNQKEFSALGFSISVLLQYLIINYSCFSICNWLLCLIIFHNLFSGDEIVSSLPLQMSLYFNVIFFPVWLTTVIIMLQLKVNHHISTTQSNRFNKEFVKHDRLLFPKYSNDRPHSLIRFLSTVNGLGCYVWYEI
jgi:hypothetical protein